MVKRNVQDNNVEDPSEISVIGGEMAQYMKDLVNGFNKRNPVCSCCGEVIKGVKETVRYINKYDWLCRNCTIDMWIKSPTFINKRQPDLDKNIMIKELRKISNEVVK